MFRQFSCRLIPFILGLIAAAPRLRGGSTCTEAAVREIDTDVGPGEGSAAESDFGPGEVRDPVPGEGPEPVSGEGPVMNSGFGPDADPPDRGDVPGWVLITLMTAGLVVALWALAGEAFTSMFQDAMNKVRGAG